MPQNFTEDMIREAYGEEDADLVLLVRVEADGLDDVGLFTDRAANLPGGQLGFTSRGETYRYAPFDFTWGGAGTDEPARAAQLEVGSVGQLVEAVRLVPKDAQIHMTVEMVRAASPDVVEQALVGARVPNAQLDGPSIIFELRGIDLGAEYACAGRYVAARMPGLFT